MNDLQIFKNDEFGSVRTLVNDGDPWFVGKDVATVLKYNRADNAIRAHVDIEDRLTHRISASGQNRNMILINESGLYSLIFSSKLPEAKRFKRWVTSEVLPALRKTGTYTCTTASAEPQRVLTADDYLRAASIVAGCRNERLPYVMGLLKQSGITLPHVDRLQPNEMSPEAVRLINKAINEHGMSATRIGKLTGLAAAQIIRIRSGQTIPKDSRSMAIISAIKEAIPEIE